MLFSFNQLFLKRNCEKEETSIRIGWLEQEGCSSALSLDLLRCIFLTNSNLYTLLVLAGIRLIFFTEAHMGLWFGFLLEAVLIIQGCFHYC